MGAGEQRGVHFKRGVFGGRADKGNQPAFNVRQEGILLGFVEAVHFVHKQNGAPAALPRHFGLGDGFADVFHARKHGGNRQKLRVKPLRHNPRQRGFADARAAPQNHRMRLAARQRNGKRLASARQVFLPEHFGKRVRAQPFGKRGAGGLGE